MMKRGGHNCRAINERLPPLPLIGSSRAYQTTPEYIPITLWLYFQQERTCFQCLPELVDIQLQEDVVANPNLPDDIRHRWYINNAGEGR
jgi:hypothetical protein